MDIKQHPLQRLSKFGVKLKDDVFKSIDGKIHSCNFYTTLITLTSLVPSISVNLNNHYDVAYTSYIYTGSQMAKGDVVFDTGSGWYALSTK